MAWHFHDTISNLEITNLIYFNDNLAIIHTAGGGAIFPHKIVLKSTWKDNMTLYMLMMIFRQRYHVLNKFYDQEKHKLAFVHLSGISGNVRSAYLVMCTWKPIGQ